MNLTALIVTAGAALLLAAASGRFGGDREQATAPGSGCAQAGRAGLANVDAEAATVENGSRAGFAATRAHYPGGHALTRRRPGYARVVERVRWHPGDEVTYSGCFFLPDDLPARMQGQVALMRWDDFPAHPHRPVQGGVVVNEPGARGELMRDLRGGRQVPVTRSFRLPTGRWFRLEVHQRLGTSPATADSRIFLDGRLIRRSRRPNLERPRTVARVRFGLVALPLAQRRPLTVWFRHLRVQGGGA